MFWLQLMFKSYHSKTGNLIGGEEYSKSFDEDVITRLDEAKKRVNSELNYLNEILDHLP